MTCSRIGPTRPESPIQRPYHTTTCTQQSPPITILNSKPKTSTAAIQPQHKPTPLIIKRVSISRLKFSNRRISSKMRLKPAKVSLKQAATIKPARSARISICSRSRIRARLWTTRAIIITRMRPQPRLTSTSRRLSIRICFVCQRLLLQRKERLAHRSSSKTA